MTLSVSLQIETLRQYRRMVWIRSNLSHGPTITQNALLHVRCSQQLCSIGIVNLSLGWISHTISRARPCGLGREHVLVYLTEKPFEQSIFEQSETIPPLEFAVQTRGEINFTPRRILPTPGRTDSISIPHPRGREATVFIQTYRW